MSFFNSEQVYNFSGNEGCANEIVTMGRDSIHPAPIFMRTAYYYPQPAELYKENREWLDNVFYEFVGNPLIGIADTNFLVFAEQAEDLSVGILSVHFCLGEIFFNPCGYNDADKIDKLR